MKCYTYENLELNGRLANQIWQIASTIGISRKHGGTARFKSDWEYRPYFSVPDSYFDKIPEDARIVDGGTEYFQQVLYFDFMIDEIRQMFQPSALSESFLKANYNQFFSIGHKTSVHVRRGDYLKHPEVFPQPTARFYQTATEMAFNDNPETVFILFSDDLPWCLQNLQYLGLTGRTFIPIEGTPRPVEVADRRGQPYDQYDLFLMAKCDNHIISNSTFAWWGAFLADSKPLYPSVWFGPSVESTVQPSDWRVVEC